MRAHLLLVLPLLFAACSSDDGGGTGTPSDAGTDTPSESATGGSGGNDEAGSDAGADASDAADAASAPEVLLPKTGLDPDELAVLVNDQDSVSVEVGDYYATARKIPPANVVHLSFPVNKVMTTADFATAKALVDALPSSVQGLVISWTTPYRVDCMSVTSAFSLGYDKKYCNTTGGACGATAPVDYFDSDSAAPFTDHGIRPSMMLAAKDATNAKALVDRGVAADDTFPTGNGWLVRTTDSARSVRWSEFVSLTQTWSHPEVMTLTYVDNSDGSGSNLVQNEKDVLFYFTGLASVGGIDTNTYRPGAVADHLTSYGGQVPTSGQMSVAAWLEAGVTASYGTVVEPCNYTSKFPDPRVVLPHYYRGGTVLEAYWKSVKTPGEGLFVGEPLARPWGKTLVTWDQGTLGIETTMLDPKHSYALESGPSATGPFTAVKTGISVPYEQRVLITLPGAVEPYYRLVLE